MLKKSQVIGNVFIYIFSVIVIGIILIMGYKYISGTKDKISQADLIMLKNKLTNDIESISTDYGSSKKVSYSIPESAELCLVDLREEARNDVLNSNLNPLIKDSVNSNVKKNAFIISSSIFESYYIEEIEISEPYFICSKTSKINLVIEGKGDRTLVKEQ